MKNQRSVIIMLVMLALLTVGFIGVSQAQQEPPCTEGLLCKFEEVDFPVICDVTNELIIVTFSEPVEAVQFFDVVINGAIVFGELFQSSATQYIIPFSAFLSPDGGSPTTVQAGDTLLILAVDSESDSGFQTSTICEEELVILPCEFDDGRVNQDCSAPVVIYEGSIMVYGIDPATSEGVLALNITDETIAGIGIPTENTILGSGTNSATGQPIAIYRLTTGEFQLNTFYADGKPYVVVWSEDGMYYLAR